jgi:hypothetical protein
LPDEAPPVNGNGEIRGFWSARPPVFPFDLRIPCFTPRMNLRLATLLLALFLIPGTAVFASGKKGTKASVTLHIETEGTDNPKMIFPYIVAGQQRFFRRMPEIMTNDIEAFSPFPAEGGGDNYGVVFKLTNRAAKRFSAVTTANQGRWMFAMVNGRAVDVLLIDKPVNDGIIVAWKGITLADTTTLDDAKPRIGADGKEKKE